VIIGQSYLVLYNNQVVLGVEAPLLKLTLVVPSPQQKRLLDPIRPRNMQKQTSKNLLHHLPVKHRQTPPKQAKTQCNDVPILL
jgi:hypothetical protein